MDFKKELSNRITAILNNTSWLTGGLCASSWYIISNIEDISFLNTELKRLPQNSYFRDYLKTRLYFLELHSISFIKGD